VGYLFQNLKVLERLFFIIGGIGVLFPLTSESHIALWILNIGGLMLCLATAIFPWRRARLAGRAIQDHQ
jgi:hypothetical protein